MTEDSFLDWDRMQALFAKLEDLIGRGLDELKMKLLPKNEQTLKKNMPKKKKTMKKDMQTKKKTMKKNMKQKLQPSWFLQRRPKFGSKVYYNKQKAFRMIGLGGKNQKLGEYLPEIETYWNLQELFSSGGSGIKNGTRKIAALGFGQISRIYWIDLMDTDWIEMVSLNTNDQWIKMPDYFKVKIKVKMNDELSLK